MFPEKPKFIPEEERKAAKQEIKSEKQRIWDEKRVEVDKIVDALGYPVDGKIREAQTACEVMGLPVIASCEGHVKPGKMAAPWVEIAAPGEPDEKFENENELYQPIAKKCGVSLREVKAEVHTWGDQADWHEEAVEAAKEAQKRDYSEAYKDWTDKNGKLHEKASQLVKEFYENQQELLPEDVVIQVGEAEDDKFRIYNGGQELNFTPEGLSADKKSKWEENLKRYQAEMDRFTAFAKEKFFSG